MKNKRGQDAMFAYILIFTALALLFLFVFSLVYFKNITQTKAALGLLQKAPPSTEEITEEVDSLKTIKTILIKKFILDIQKLLIVFLVLIIIFQIKNIIKPNKKK